VLAAPGRTPAATVESPEVVAALLQRGDAMLRKGDVVSARLFYERAAAAGSGQGATGAGKTYDPKFLASINAIGMKGDVARAIEWYRVASTLLGDTEGGERLKLLIAQGGQ
jgi:TPR repeat protein